MCVSGSTAETSQEVLGWSQPLHAIPQTKTSREVLRLAQLSDAIPQAKASRYMLQLVWSSDVVVGVAIEVGADHEG